MICVFCRSEGGFNTKEHVIPESLGNDDLVATELVCDKCQNYLGKEVEAFVLSNTPFAFWRVWYSLKTKSGALPHVDLTLPTKNKGRLPSSSEHNDQHIGFAAHDDGSVSLDIDNESILREILTGKRHKLNFALTPQRLSFMGRFLGKIGIELLAIHDRSHALSPGFDPIRRYVRYGRTDSLWPILNGRLATRLDLWQDDAANRGQETRTIYQYQVVEVETHTVLLFDIGWETWGIVLDCQYPPPRLNETLEGSRYTKMSFVWYSDQNWKHR